MPHWLQTLSVGQVVPLIVPGLYVPGGMAEHKSVEMRHKKAVIAMLKIPIFIGDRGMGDNKECTCHKGLAFIIKKGRSACMVLPFSG